MSETEQQPRRYRKKPVVIEAMQWTGNNLDAIKAFVGTDPDGYSPRNVRLSADGETLLLWVEKSGAMCDVYLNGWVLAEPDGEGFYPCAETVFESTFEAVDSDA